MNGLKPIDHSEMVVSQITLILLNTLAFLFDLPWLAGLIAAVMLIGAIVGFPGFGFVYRLLLKPLGWVKPHVAPDNAEPHRFAQGLGGTFVLAGALALWAGLASLGWGLVWMVSALAALNAFGGFCVGCFVYYWLARWKVPGFTKHPPAGVFPGMRPVERSKK